MNGIPYFLVYLILLVGLAFPLGRYLARVYDDEPTWARRILGPIERAIYRLCGLDPKSKMDWKRYAFAVLAFNALGFALVYLVLRLQGMLPLNPRHFDGLSPHLAFNTAISFATNTNWQAYSGESTLSYFSQVFGLAVQNFVSAATGMAVLIALIRGIRAKTTTAIGNFWVDLTRSVLYVLLPLSLILATVLVAQGVVQSFDPYPTIQLLQPVKDVSGNLITEQILPLGPAASQIAIKQLGTNGGGFFGVNSAHPFENPTPLANFLELLAILLIPAALCLTFGHMVKDRRQGWAILAAMVIIFIASLGIAHWSEQGGNPRLTTLGVAQASSDIASGGNMEGKEVRFGIASSVLWATATTAASNGSVNAMHDSFTPLGGLVPLWLMQLGEVVFGGVGSGLYGMLMFVLIAVFVAGLMVGRTPEYLGKKIEAFEMKMAAISILIPPALVLLGTALAVSLTAGVRGVLNPGPHGFTEILYAFSSAGNNNGSSFAGLSVNTPFYNVALGVCMLAARYWLIIPALAVAGSLAAKKRVPESAGTLPTHGPLFIILVVGTILLVGALTFVPALALGPLVEQLLF